MVKDLKDKIKYGLKIFTDFSEKEIKENTRVIDIDEAKHIEIRENNFTLTSPTPPKEGLNTTEQESKENPLLGRGQGEVRNFLSHTIINLNTEGASVEFIGRYKAEKSLCDVSCIVNHNANNTKSKINIKGIAKENGKIISRSNIYVPENIKGIEGEEKCKFIFVVNPFLGRGQGEVGEIDAIPNLDINSNEVKVSHALSISKIKKADVWYAGLHAFSEKDAEKSFEESFLN